MARPAMTCPHGITPKGECRECGREAHREFMKNYNQRPDVKERRKAYLQRPEIKEKLEAYNKAYYKRPEVKERLKAYNKAYYQRPEIKEKQREYAKAYLQRPEIKERLEAYNKAYYKRPEIKERQKAYHQRPEVKARMKAYHKAYNKAYYKRPEVKERKEAYRLERVFVPAIRSAYSRMEKDAEKEMAEARKNYGYVPVELEGKWVMARNVLKNLDVIHEYVQGLQVSPEVKHETEAQLINNMLEKEGLLVSRRRKLMA